MDTNRFEILKELACVIGVANACKVFLESLEIPTIQLLINSPLHFNVSDENEKYNGYCLRTIAIVSLLSEDDLPYSKSSEEEIEITILNELATHYGDSVIASRVYLESLEIPTVEIIKKIPNIVVVDNDINDNDKIWYHIDDDNFVITKIETDDASVSTFRALVLYLYTTR